MTRRALRTAFVISGVVVALLAITPFLIQVNQFRPFIEGRASAALAAVASPSLGTLDR